MQLYRHDNQLNWHQNRFFMSVKVNKGYVKVLQQKGYGEVLFHHPKANSMTSELLIELATGIQVLSVKEENHAILLRSEGKNFCTGASFNELVQINSQEEGEAFFMGFAKVILAMRQAPIPVVALAQGVVIGGGIGILGAADLVIATQESQYKLSELKVGIGPFVISPVLEGRIGSAALLKMAFFPEDFHTAKWAESVGLVSKVVTSAQLLDEGKRKLHELSQQNRAALCKIKAIRQDVKLEEQMKRYSRMSAELVCQPHTKKYLNQFLSK